MKVKNYIFIAGLFIASACSEEVKVLPFTYPEIFTGETKKTWQIRSIQYIQDGKGTQTFGLDDCVLDDKYEFYNDFQRTYRVLNGAKKCEDDEPSILADSNWSFVNATASFTLTIPLLSSTPINGIAKEITADRMSVDFYLDQKSAYRVNFKVASGG